MTTPSGISPLDERMGGLRPGGLYVVSGAPGSGRLVALMQFLAAGLDDGNVGLVTAAPPARVFEEATYWGFDLEGAWREGRLRLLTLADDFERRLTSSPDPSEVYEEMGELLGTDVVRIALHPGTPLWDTRSGTSFATRFLRWIDGSEATVFASIGASLEESGSPATEWVLQAASGIFHLDVLDDGLREIAIQRATPAPKDDTPIVVDLSPGEGIVAGAGRERRRGARLSDEAQRNLLVLNLGGELPVEVRSWASKRYTVTEVDEALRGVELVETGADRFGTVLVYMDRGSLEGAVRSSRLIRRLSDVPILLLTQDAIRSSDRLSGLQAGANDVMSGPISVLELASRVDQAVIAGGRPVAEPGSSANDRAGEDRVLAHAEFMREVRERLGGEREAPFTFVLVSDEDGSTTRRAIQGAVRDTIRHEQGDRVGVVPGGVGVILDGSPLNQVPAFVKRVEANLSTPDAESAKSGGPHVEWVALTSAADADKIREAVGEPTGSGRLSLLKSAS